MAKGLVIVESPAKAKTINKILGHDYLVVSSMGHVRDLPEKKFGVDVKKGFAPSYVNVKRQAKVIQALSKEAKKCEAVYLAPDPDREGEAIAWHLKCLLEKVASKAKFYRVSYNEITPRAVRAAFAHPTDLDMKRVWAQQARRIIDRIVGYRVSPLLWRRVRRGSSAGRVQSVALRLICEREQKILDFAPESYWIMGARARKLIAPLDPFDLALTRINEDKAEIKSPEQAASIQEDLEGRKLRVKEVTTREVSRKAPPPFITSTLQQSASTWLGFSPARTMALAQRLYEGVDISGETVGLITYMRTDSVAIANEAVKACRTFISDNHTADFLPDKANLYKSKKGAQEAHEAIRPTDVARTPKEMAPSLEPPAAKLYGLIWRRFVASQMTPAKIKQRGVDVEAAASEASGASYLFHATSSDIIFPGFMKVAGIPAQRKRKEEEEAAGGAQQLPPLVQGESLQCLEWLTTEKETKPPNRFTEAALVKALDDNGVGRPSTYAQILGTLNRRQYAKRVKRTLIPTELGLKVSHFLTTDLSQLFDVGFTAKMEESLDQIEEGNVNWEAMVGEFYSDFSKWLEKAKGPPADKEKLEWILVLLEGVQEWAAPTQAGKRKYDDHKFVESIRKQIATAKKPVTERQLLALVGMGLRYEQQLPGLHEKMTEAGLGPLLEQSLKDMPSENSISKLKVFDDIKWNPPVERAGRTYDDGVFVQSLQAQVVAGRGLSAAQERSLDRLFLRYRKQIPDVAGVAEKLGIHVPEGRDEEAGAFADLLQNVATWCPPVVRRGREFDDKALFADDHPVNIFKGADTFDNLHTAGTVAGFATIGHVLAESSTLRRILPAPCRHTRPYRNHYTLPGFCRPISFHLPFSFLISTL